MSLIPLGFWAASGGGAGGAYDLLETQILTSSASSVTFTGLDTLAAGYQHLQLRMVSQESGSVDTGALRFNGDSGSNYTRHYLFGNGSSVQSNNQLNENQMGIFRVGESTQFFDPAVIDILDFSSTTKNKVARSFTGKLGGAENDVWLFSGLWNNTSAITSIEIKTFTGNNFVSGSRFSLFGVKG